MDLGRIAVAIRPRTPWEAVDLGFRMARSWWRPLLGSWLVVAAPLWILTFLLLHRRPLIALAVVWWLRPLVDRVPLYVLSRAVFGAPPGVGETLRALPRLLLENLAGALLWRRFDPARSFRLPVWQLEGETGARRRERMRILDREGRREGTSLTFACILMETCLLLGFLGLASLMTPGLGLDEVMDAGARGLEGEAPLGLGLLAAAAFAAHALVEPCYVAAGFSLYLRARTRLEGWDVELGLRRLAARLGRFRGAAVLLAFLVSALLASAGRPASARVANTVGGGGDPGELVHEVLDHPDFETRREVTTWRARDWVSGLPRPSVAPRAGRVGNLGKPLAGTLAVLLLTFIAWQVLRLLRRSGWHSAAAAGSEGPAALPETVQGRAPDRVPLPDDVAGAAWELWTRGRSLEALGLLYRGALDRLVRQGVVPVDASWTEGQVLREVGHRLPVDRRRYLTDLTGAWTAAAYAHRLPDDERARALCDAWAGRLGEVS